MKVRLEGLIKILYRDWGWLYSKQEIAKIIEEEGSRKLDNKITYLGFGVWEIAK